MKRMKSEIFRVLAALCLMCLCTEIQAEEYMDMSLDELLNTKVTTASKKAENISEAPGIVTIITSKDIDTFGANNLTEVLARVAGIYMTGSYLYPQNVTSVRGDLITHLDNHILILMNGRPVRETTFGGINYPIYLSLPLSAVDRIEIIRGPGSVLYGTNAYSGVINIITKKQTDKTIQGDISAKYGSSDTTATDSTVMYHQGDLSLTAGIKYFREGGWELRAIDEKNAERSGDFGENNLGMILSGEYKNFTINTLLAKSDQAHFGSVPVWNSPAKDALNEIETERILADIGYKYEISNSWKLNANITYNGCRMDFDLPPGPNSTTTDDFLLELSNNLEFSNKINLTFGGTVYLMSGKTTLNNTVVNKEIDLIPDYDETWYSVYSQADYKFSERLKLILGAQANKTENSDWRLVPRAGAIFNFNEHLGTKLLYSEAFRSPFQAERNIRTADIIGNNNLSPETITTLDLQIFYNTERFEISAVYFNSTQDELISRIADHSPGSIANIYVNQGKIESQGIELEAKIMPVKDMFISASYVYQENKKDGQENYTTIPNTMFKLGASYRTDNGFRFGIFNSYIGKPHDASVRNPDVRYVNPDSDAYHLLTANISLDLKTFFNLCLKQPVAVNLYGYNLFDEDIDYPEYNRSRINTLPAGQGRSVYVGLTWSF